MTTIFQKLLLLIVVAAVNFPVAIRAQDKAHILPDTFAVKDVAADDVLNIRTLPDATGEIMGSLGQADEGIEVIRLSEDGRWGLVNQVEQSGWVSMQFLDAEESDYGLLDRQLECFGTEPFWDFSIQPGGAAQFKDFNTPGDAVNLVSNWSAKQWYDRSGPELAEFQSGELRLNASFTRGYCTDGMSDAEYGIIFVGHLSDGGGGLNYNGCCSLNR